MKLERLVCCVCGKVTDTTDVAGTLACEGWQRCRSTLRYACSSKCVARVAPVPRETTMVMALRSRGKR